MFSTAACAVVPDTNVRAIKRQQREKELTTPRTQVQNPGPLHREVVDQMPDLVDMLLGAIDCTLLKVEIAGSGANQVVFPGLIRGEVEMLPETRPVLGVVADQDDLNAGAQVVASILGVVVALDPVEDFEATLENAGQGIFNLAQHLYRQEDRLGPIVRTIDTDNLSGDPEVVLLSGQRH